MEVLGLNSSGTNMLQFTYWIHFCTPVWKRYFKFSPDTANDFSKTSPVIKQKVTFWTGILAPPIIKSDIWHEIMLRKSIRLLSW
jgi:hypothetical protein